MKIKPQLIRVHVDSSAWGVKEGEYLERQESYRGFDFLTLSEFNPGAEYSQNLLEESDLVLSREQVTELAIAGIRFDVKQKIDIDVDITKQIIEMAEKPITLTTEQGSTNNYNTKCEVHMPGQALSLYNEVLLLEDACTDELQTNLQSGWRIIAACPQPDQRRPDYILGRYNSEM